jgi:hypothetical protein
MTDDALALSSLTSIKRRVCVGVGDNAAVKDTQTKLSIEACEHMASAKVKNSATVT